MTFHINEITTDTKESMYKYGFILLGEFSSKEEFLSQDWIFDTDNHNFVATEENNLFCIWDLP